MKRCIIAVAVIVSLVAPVRPAHAQAAPAPESAIVAPVPVPASCPTGPCTEKVPGKTIRDVGIGLFTVGALGLLTGAGLWAALFYGRLDHDFGAFGTVLIGAVTASAVANLILAGAPMWIAGQVKMNRARRGYTLAPVISPNRAAITFGFEF